MKHGARNQITGTVTEIKKGGVMCQVKVDTKAGNISSVMTLESLDSMGLKKGDQVSVLIKAVNTILVKE
ncbi:MAG: TOBE domain-containing protein [Planctomycetes bacterium]|nr:TOBE domain-containing protein [Planctomycetota bacterium]